MEVFIKGEELKLLNELATEAKKTGVNLRTSCCEPESEPNMQAWDRLQEFMDELGRRYNFDPSVVKGINEETGQVLL